MSRSGGAPLILNSLCQDIATVPRTERDFIHPSLLAKHGLCSLQPCCNHRQQNQEETFRVSEGEAVSGQRPAAQRLDVGSEPLGNVTFSYRFITAAMLRLSGLKARVAVFLIHG